MNNSNKKNLFNFIVILLAFAAIKLCEAAMTDIDLEQLVEETKIMAMNNGLFSRTPEHLDKNDNAQFVPFALYPTPFPQKLYNQAASLQQAMNLLYFRISLNFEFLEQTLQTIAPSNSDVRGLLNILKEVKIEGNKQPITLVLERSDYMAHVNKNGKDELKQIEVNIGQIGGQARADRITKIHRHFMQKAGFSLANMPLNGASEMVAEALFAAWKAFGDQNAIMVVVAGRTYQNFEQHQLIESVRKLSDYKLKVANLSLIECNKMLTLDENDFTLRYKGKVVGLVYHKTVIIYLTPQHLAARLKIERSTAIKCPTVALELACTKKVQQVLALPGVLESFFTVQEAEIAAAIRSTFAGLWGMENEDENTLKIIEDAIANPDNYVLKPSQEGGGNNFWGKQIAQKLLTFKPSQKAAHILMEQIKPRVRKNYLVRPLKPTKLEDVVSELSIYGFLLGNAHDMSIQQNQHRGFMLRTKLESTKEGGIGAGGGVHDSPYLY